MGRIDPEILADAELVFLAATLAEAKQVEELLTGNGVDYVVHVQPFGTSLFGSPRSGAFFSVAGGQAAYCRSLLTATGLGRGVLTEDPPT